MDIHILEGDFFHEVNAHHHHSGHPRKTGYQRPSPGPMWGRTFSKGRFHPAIPGWRNGHRAELNQVSSNITLLYQDWNCRNPGRVSGVSISTMTFPQDWQVPGWNLVSPPDLTGDAPVPDIFPSSHNRFWTKMSGIIWVWPVFTASMAFSARGLAATNHCLDRLGSMTVWHR